MVGRLHDERYQTSQPYETSKEDKKDEKPHALLTTTATKENEGRNIVPKRTPISKFKGEKQNSRDRSCSSCHKTAGVTRMQATRGLNHDAGQCTISKLECNVCRGTGNYGKECTIKRAGLLVGAADNCSELDECLEELEFLCRVAQSFPAPYRGGLPGLTMAETHLVNGELEIRGRRNRFRTLPLNCTPMF